MARKSTDSTMTQVRDLLNAPLANMVQIQRKVEQAEVRDMDRYAQHDVERRALQVRVNELNGAIQAVVGNADVDADVHGLRRHVAQIEAATQRAVDHAATLQRRVNQLENAMHVAVGDPDADVPALQRHVNDLGAQLEQAKAATQAAKTDAAKLQGNLEACQSTNQTAEKRAQELQAQLDTLNAEAIRQKSKFESQVHENHASRQALEEAQTLGREYRDALEVQMATAEVQSSVSKTLDRQHRASVEEESMSQNQKTHAAHRRQQHLRSELDHHKDLVEILANTNDLALASSYLPFPALGDDARGHDSHGSAQGSGNARKSASPGDPAGRQPVPSSHGNQNAQNLLRGFDSGGPYPLLEYDPD